MSRSDISIQSRCIQFENALDFAQSQVKKLIEAHPDLKEPLDLIRMLKEEGVALFNIFKLMPARPISARGV